MVISFIKTWLKRVYKKLSELCNSAGFTWDSFGKIAIQESVLTMITVCITTVLVNKFHAA